MFVSPSPLLVVPVGYNVIMIGNEALDANVADKRLSPVTRPPATLLLNCPLLAGITNCLHD